MSCVQHATRLREHAHGAPLSPELEAHLASCAVCQEVLAAEQQLLSEIDRALDGVGRVEPSPIFLARARAAALEQPLPSSRPSRLLPVPAPWPIWALPALAAVLFIMALVARTRPSVERAPTNASAPGVVSPPAVPSSPGVSSVPPPLVAEHSPAPPVESPSSSPRLPSHSLTHPSFSEPAIVPPGQADALVRLAALIDGGSMAAPAMLLEPPDPNQELRPPADLRVRPLAIAPIVDGGSDNEGDTL